VGRKRLHACGRSMAAFCRWNDPSQATWPSPPSGRRKAASVCWGNFVSALARCAAEVGRKRHHRKDKALAKPVLGRPGPVSAAARSGPGQRVLHCSRWWRLDANNCSAQRQIWTRRRRLGGKGDGRTWGAPVRIAVGAGKGFLRVFRSRTAAARELKPGCIGWGAGRFDFPIKARRAVPLRSARRSEEAERHRRCANLTLGGGGLGGGVPPTQRGRPSCRKAFPHRQALRALSGTSHRKSGEVNSEFTHGRVSALDGVPRRRPIGFAFAVPAFSRDRPRPAIRWHGVTKKPRQPSAGPATTHRDHAGPMDAGCEAPCWVGHRPRRLLADHIGQHRPQDEG